MRIVGGAAKSRRIYSPPKSKIRPTSDGIKESLFNMLRDVSGKSFLDLFAGSGGVGLEALSRGAAKVVFVEKSPVMISAIKRNLKELGLGGQSEILEIEAAKGIKQLRKRGETFDFLFADPPYEKGLVEEIFLWLDQADIVASDGVVIIQHSIREDVKIKHTDNFTLTDQRRYGDTLISFLKRTAKKEEMNI